MSCSSSRKDGRTRTRHHYCRLTSCLRRNGPGIDDLIVTANSQHFLSFLETLTCRVRRAWRSGTKIWSPWWRWRSMWDFADVSPFRQVRSRPPIKGTLPARHPGQLWSFNLYDHRFSLVIGAETNPVIVHRIPSLVRLLKGSCRLGSAVSTTALPCNKGQYTLQHPMTASTLQALMVLVQHSPRVTLTSVVGIC